MVKRLDEPETLWHYTDANGLWGLVESRQFRFGDAGFLNDRTERIYGRQVLDSVFDEEISRGDGDGFLQKLREHVRLTRSSDRLFICSFSASKESISQWQRYGADGSGYCIGFNTKTLDELFDRDMVQRVPMIYREENQRSFFRDKILRGVDSYRRTTVNTTGKQDNRVSVYGAIFTAGDVDDAVFRMKNPFFQDEAEWRYFETVEEEELDDVDSEEQFAPRGPYIKPFILLPRQRKRAALELLPIASVVCGPRLDPGVALPTVARYLRSHGYRDVIVEASALAAIWR